MNREERRRLKLNKTKPHSADLVFPELQDPKKMDDMRRHRTRDLLKVAPDKRDLAFAVAKTDRMVTVHNRKLLSKADWAEWQAAVREAKRLKVDAMGEKEFLELCDRETDAWARKNPSTGKELPKPNVRFHMDGEELDDFDEASVRAMFCNPIYAGVDPYPAVVSDHEWVTAAVSLIKEEGPEQFLVNLLECLRATYKGCGVAADEQPARAT